MFDKITKLVWICWSAWFCGAGWNLANIWLCIFWCYFVAYTKKQIQIEAQRKKCNISIPQYQSQYFQKSSRLFILFREGNQLTCYYRSIFFAISSDYFEGSYFKLKGFPVFLQPQHLQDSEHPTPELQHSQYRLRQLDFLQLHRFYAKLQLRRPPSLIVVFAWAIYYLNFSVFLHSRQAQSSPHSLPVEKHSQYILRQQVFLHVQPVFFFLAEGVVVCGSSMRYPSESYSFSGVNLRGNYILSIDQWLGMPLMVLIILRVWLMSGKFYREGRLKNEFLDNLECIDRLFQ